MKMKLFIAQKKILEQLEKKSFGGFLKRKYFDNYATELHYFRDMPFENKIRIYFEYWFLLKKLRDKRVDVKKAIIERNNLGLSKKNFHLGRILSQISSNGCMSVYTPDYGESGFNNEDVIDIDFNYFNKANPTYKVGKFSTEDIFATISKPDENEKTIEKMSALLSLLNEFVMPKKDM